MNRVKGWVDRDYIGNIGDESLADDELHVYVEEIPPDAVRIEAVVEEEPYDMTGTGFLKLLYLPAHLIGKRVQVIIFEEDV